MMRKFLGALLLLPALACAQILGGTTPSTGFGATPGISGQTTQPSFAAALTTTVVPSIALGSPTATFTRATTATVVDQDQVVRSVLSGEVRFQGARRVRNRIVGTENSAGWGGVGGGTGSVATVSPGFTAPDGTATAFRILANLNGGATGADTSYMDFPIGGPVDMAVPVHSVWLKNNGGQNTILLRQSSAAAAYLVTVDNTWRRYSITSAGFVAGVGAIFSVGTRGNINPGSFVDVLVWHPQFEDAVGQSNPNPSEYVSSGVLASPFQGANVDGVQYFGYQNGNAVQQNLLPRSQELDNATWTKNFSTVTPDVIAAPDGTLTADKLAEDNSSNLHRVFESTALPLGQYTFSVSLKAAERSKAFVVMSDGVSGSAGVTVDLSAGTLTNDTATVGSWTNAISSIQSLPGGWFRVTLSARSGAGTSVLTIVYSSNGASGSSTVPYIGTTGSGIYVWGAQLQPGAAASTYVATTSAAVNTNVVESLALGPQIPSATLLGYLAEGLRTNLETQSQTFSSWVPTDITVTPNSLVAPDGTTTGALLTAGVAGTAGLNSAAITATANVNYAVSMWAKRGNNDWLFLRIGATGATCDNWFNLNTGALGTSTAGGTAVANSRTITAFPAGWYRITSDCAMNGAQTVITPLLVMTSADAVTTRVNNSTVNVWGAQFEDNVSFASSYIPTTTVAVARNGDVLSYAGAGNTSVTVGTAYAELSTVWTTNDAVSEIALANTDSSGRLLYAGASNASNVITMFDGTTLQSSSITSMTGVARKAASAWGGATMSVTGTGNVPTGAAFDGAMGVVTALTVGHAGSSNNWFGTIRNALIWPAKLTDAQLQGLTGP